MSDFRLTILGMIEGWLAGDLEKFLFSRSESFGDGFRPLKPQGGKLAKNLYWLVLGHIDVFLAQILKKYVKSKIEHFFYFDQIVSVRRFCERPKGQ